MGNMFNDNNPINNNDMFNQNNNINNANNMPNNNMKPVQPKKGNKTIIVILLIVALIGIVAAIAVPKISNLISESKDEKKLEKKDDEKDKDQDKEVNKEKEYQTKYGEYLKEEIFSEKDKVEAVLIDFDNDETPELVIKYLNRDDASTLKVLYIRGDEVRESSQYPYSYLCILYDVEEEKPNYYFEHKDYDTSYYYVKDIISDKVDVDEIELDDEFAYKYVRADVNFDMYSINKDNVEKDVERLIEKYEEKDTYITEEEEKNIKDEIDKIKSNNVTKDSSGFHTGEFNAAYGTYTLDNMTFVFNSNDSCTFNTSYITANGSFHVEYDRVKFVSSSYKFEFKVVDNDKLQLVKSDYWGAEVDTIWNKK